MECYRRANQHYLLHDPRPLSHAGNDIARKIVADGAGQ